MNKREINYVASISENEKYNFYLEFGIDIIDLLENIFKVKGPYQEPSLIREKYVYGFNRTSNPNNLSYLKSIKIDDYKINNNGELLYMDVVVDTNLKKVKYILYFDHLNNLVEVERNEKDKEDIRYRYHLDTKEVFINKNESYLKVNPILSKVTLFNDKEEALRFSKYFTKKEQIGVSFLKDNVKYRRLKYKFENNYLESFIIMEVEDKESNRSYTEIDSERGKVYRNKFMVPEVIDSYIMMLNNALDVESTLMLYEKIKEKLIFEKDNYNYKLTINTRLKRFGRLSNYEEIITDTNGIINLDTNVDVDIKRKIKK